MAEQSVARPACTNTPNEVLAERIEQEISRLRAAKPELDSRIDRAANLLVVQLAAPKQARPVTLRVGAGGRVTFLVASLTQRGVVYAVDPDAWTCTCPDYHRRSVACKHIVIAYVLRRVATRRGCRHCTDGVIYLTVVKEDGHEQDAPVPCRRCSGGER
jgi:hypothetical protein